VSAQKKAAAASKREPRAEEGPGSNRSVRLTEQTFRDWRLFCSVRGMSYDASLAWLLAQHPLSIEDLRLAHRNVR